MYTTYIPLLNAVRTGRKLFFGGEHMGKRSPAVLTLLFIILALFLSSCASMPQQDFISCERDPHSRYMEVLESSFPSLAINRNESDIFRELNNGTATEAFYTQAIPALRDGIAAYWYPQYLATVVIASDRRTDQRLEQPCRIR